MLVLIFGPEPGLELGLSRFMLFIGCSTWNIFYAAYPILIDFGLVMW